MVFPADELAGKAEDQRLRRQVQIGAIVARIGGQFRVFEGIVQAEVHDARQAAMQGWMVGGFDRLRVVNDRVASGQQGVDHLARQPFKRQGDGLRPEEHRRPQPGAGGLGDQVALEGAADDGVDLLGTDDTPQLTDRAQIAPVAQAVGGDALAGEHLHHRVGRFPKAGHVYLQAVRVRIPRQP